MAFFDLGSALGAAMAPRRRVYSPGKSMAKSLGWEYDPDEVPLDTPPAISYADSLQQSFRPDAASFAADPNQITMPVAPLQEQPRNPMAEAMGPVQPYRNKFYQGDTLPDLPVFMRDSHFQAWAKQNPEQIQEYQNMKAFGMSPRQYEDMMNQPKPPPAPRSVRFIGSGGTETANYAADNTFLGGDYRGQAYKPGERDAAVDAWNKIQGGRETGIAGTPSIEGIMNNQLGGLPMSPEQKRMMAIGMQQQFSIQAAGLERERIQADEADKNRKAVFSAKQQEILGFHMNQFDEKNPFATQAERDTYRDKVARGIGAEIPKSLTAQGSVTNTATDPLSGAVLGARMGDLDSIFASEKGKSFVPTEASAASLMRVLADTPEASRKSVLDAAMMKAAAYPEFRKLLMQQMLQKYMTATGARFNRTGMTVGPDQTGLPFTVKTSPQPGYMGFIPGGFMAGPKVTIEPDGGGAIPFPWAEKPWESSRLLTDDIERRRMLDEIRATSPLLEALRNAR